MENLVTDYEIIVNSKCPNCGKDLTCIFKSLKDKPEEIFNNLINGQFLCVQCSKVITLKGFGADHKNPIRYNPYRNFGWGNFDNKPTKKEEVKDKQPKDIVTSSAFTSLDVYKSYENTIKREELTNTYTKAIYEYILNDINKACEKLGKAKDKEKEKIDIEMSRAISTDQVAGSHITCKIKRSVNIESNMALKKLYHDIYFIPAIINDINEKLKAMSNNTQVLLTEWKENDLQILYEATWVGYIK